MVSSLSKTGLRQRGIKHATHARSIGFLHNDKRSVLEQELLHKPYYDACTLNMFLCPRQSYNSSAWPMRCHLTNTNTSTNTNTTITTTNKTAVTTAITAMAQSPTHQQVAAHAYAAGIQGWHGSAAAAAPRRQARQPWRTPVRQVVSTTVGTRKGLGNSMSVPSSQPCSCSLQTCTHTGSH